MRASTGCNHAHRVTWDAIRANVRFYATVCPFCPARTGWFRSLAAAERAFARTFVRPTDDEIRGARSN
jgi:hypothetical protein